MREKRVWAGFSFLQSGIDSDAELFCVPVDDDGSEEIEACHAIVLTFGSAVTDFALASDAQGVFQGVVSLAFIQSDLGAALHVRIE